MANFVTSIVTYTFLYLTVILLWVPSFKKVAPWIPALLISTVFGLISHRVDLIGLAFILILGCATFCLDNQKILLLRILSAVVLFALGIGLSLHLLPGFHNLCVLKNVQVSQNGVPFSLYLNFDKTVLGIFILGILHQKIMTKSGWSDLFKSMVPRAVVILLLISILSFSFKFVWFDPKLPSYFPIWALTNLLFVCLAEESFFRGFIQHYLCLSLRKLPSGNLIAILIASILFGLSHFMGGIQYVILATVAGAGYGWVYLRAQRIEASILTHFSVNLVHFLGFTYPALAT